MIINVLAYLALFIWLALLLFWGQFWLGVKLDSNERETLDNYPDVWVVIPARDEADVIAESLTSILQQDYPGFFSVALVDDNSSDDTAEIARETANKLEKKEQLHLISGKSLPSEWKGKLWALEQGINYAKQQKIPDYILLTDADIKHHSSNLKELITKAETEQLDLVSLMVLLRCQSFWEKLLIPAFVFFFQKLYPFKLANNPRSFIAAAAGGCIVVKTQALERIGGIASLKDALIDDCTLAKKVKTSGGKIWLGLTDKTVSLRPYESLKSIWDLVARTAFDQLNYSWLLLIGTILGLALVYLVPPLAVIYGIIAQDNKTAIIGMVTIFLISLSYLPTVKLYQLSPWWSLSLSAIAFLYGLMTIDSAFKHLRGKGGFWKGRVYQ